MKENYVARYAKGDYVKAEFRDEQTGESEWMWVQVDICDEGTQIVLGQLDSVPILDHGAKLRPGSRVAVSYGNIREFKRASEFNVH